MDPQELSKLQETQKQLDREKAERDKRWIDNACVEAGRQVFEKSQEIGGIELLYELMGCPQSSNACLYTHTLDDLVTTKERLLAELQEYRQWGQHVSEVRLNLPEVILLKDTIDDRLEVLRELDQQLAIESAGVAQALDALRKALDEVESRLKEKKHEEVSDLGYRDVSSEFIFLQRTMGQLQTAAHELTSTVSEIAQESSLTFEQVEPFVKAALSTER